MQFAISKIEAKAIFNMLFTFEIILIALYLIIKLALHSQMKFFDLDLENNLPSWFSASQLLVTGLIFILKFRLPNSITNINPYFFLLLGLGYIFLSLDEAASIHEKLNYPLQLLSNAMPRFENDYGVWILPYIIVGCIFLILTYKSIIALWKEYRQPTYLMIVGTTIFITGGIVFEILSYKYLRTGATPIAYFLEVAIEEFFEMFGISVTLYAALQLHSV